MHKYIYIFFDGLAISYSWSHSKEKKKESQWSKKMVEVQKYKKYICYNSQMYLSQQTITHSSKHI